MSFSVVPKCLSVCFVFASLIEVASAAPRKPSSLHKPRQYKRTHQAALEMIMKGNTADAIKGLEAHAKSSPKDAETQYMLAVAYAKSGNTKGALAATQRAIDLGLPAARFVAGTRTGLESLQKEKQYMALVDQNRGRPAFGPMLGDVSGNSVKIWVRTIGAASVKVEYGRNKTLKDPQTTEAVRTSTELDFTAVIELSGLKANAEHYYRVLIEPKGKDQAPPKIHKFRTISPIGMRGKVRIAFGGGAGFVPPNERVWDTIAKQKPQALLLLGDNVYSDMPTSPEMQHFSYYRRQSRPEFQRLVSSVPVYSIWDDHDFGTNDCWGGPETDEPKWKRPVWNVFRNNWVNPAYGGGEKQPGCWYDFYLGDVHFIMLDGRYYRTSPKLKEDERSMLGPAQKKWLFDTIAASKSTFKVLCSPVPWDYRTKGGSPDTWNGYKKERDEIFAFLDKNDVNGVLLMSADRHRSDLWKIERPGNYPLYEFNSSRLTNQHVHGTMKKAVFSYNKKQSFGVVDFDTTTKDPTAVYSIVTIDGETVFDVTIKRSNLKHGGDFTPTSEYEVAKVRGWKVLVDPRVVKKPELKKAALREIEAQLYRIERLVSPEAVEAMRKTIIWLEESAEYRSSYHPGRRWLIGNGINPDKEKSVEIASAAEMVNKPGYRPEMLLLHELIHAYHDQVLGFDHPAIIEAYDRVLESKKLETVRHIRGGLRKHYALENAKEFFAEMSETYLLANDYYPFVRAELRESDPETYVLLKRIWSEGK